MAIENIILIFNVRATHGSGQLADLPQATTIGGVEGAGGAEVQSLGSAVVFSYNPIWGVPEMGDPQNCWFIRENPNQKWMMTGGSPMT